MRDTIDQFMWGFQQSFRRGLERAVEKVFEELGQPCRVTGYLIGILEPGGDRHPLCVEPEDGMLTPADFEGVGDRAEELYRSDPESTMFHTVARQHERRHRWAHQRAFGEAIKEVIEHHAGGDLTCFVGQPVVVEQHLVYPVIGIPTSIVKSVPTLERDTADDPRWKVAPSIVHAALEAVLAQALRALHLSDAGEAAEIGVGTDEILRFAIGRLGEAAVVLSGNEYGGSLADAMNRVCTMRYEQRVGVGRLVVAQRGCQGVDVDVTFRRPVSLRDTRTLRKLLELSDRDGPALLTDGDEVYGIGGVNDSYDTSSERAFDVTVAGDGTWELAHAITPLVTVKYGVPRLPEERLGKQRFTHVVQRVFGADIDADVDELWSLAVAASEAAHGTMIVVSLAAAEEADRLGSQALPVEPVRLASHLLGNVTEIDGAILVDPAGNCHGLGVILDGNAGDVGDRSRGARYNSAVRYLSSASSPTVIVIASEDGMINLLPNLLPRVASAFLALLMDDLRAAAAIEPVHAERFYKAFDDVKAYRFYLSPDQCAEANALCADHWGRRRAAGGIVVTERELERDSQMDDSYLTDQA